LNKTALIEFNKELNSQANVREYLISSTINLTITTSNSIKIQASSLAQLTKATNQLTRTSLKIASKKCYDLSVALYAMSKRITYEDAQTAATHLMQCASNVLTVRLQLHKGLGYLLEDFRRSMDHYNNEPLC
jgi:hypothetical protein